MAESPRPAIGLSVGGTTLAAVTADRSVTRRAVITLFRHQPALVGLPTENPVPDEAGLVITDFVDRVGDPVPVVAADGSVHPGEGLLAEALRALAGVATGGRPLPPAVAVTYPAHWRGPAVEALRRALRRMPEWSATEPLLIPDTAAALTALQADPGLPTRGVVALCDFGGSGTGITFVEAGSHQPIAASVRHLDFSGDLIDQAVLAHVVAELSAGGAVDTTSTSAIGSLTHLRAECRAAKERLSSASVTSLPAQLRGFRGDVRLTRTELDDAIAPALAEFVAAVQDGMARSGVRPADLTAIATVGGGATVPAVTTALSQHLRVPVITTPRPALTAAIGAALRASRGPADDSATALAPAAPVVVPPVVAEPPAPSGRALAWSEADDIPDLAPPLAGHARRKRDPAPMTGAGPLLEFDQEPVAAADGPAPWYRRPMPVVAAALLVILAAGAGTALALEQDGSAAPAAPAPSISTGPSPSPQTAPPSEAPANPPSAPLQNQATQAPATAPTRVVQAPPAATAAAPPPVSTEAPPPPVTETVTSTAVSTAPPVTETATVAPPPTFQPGPLIPTIPPIPKIPGLAQLLPLPSASG